MTGSHDLPKSRLERLFVFCLEAGRTKTLGAVGLLAAAIAIADWSVGLDVSLGILYIIPMLLAALVLKPRGILVLAVICALLRKLFENPHSETEVLLRFLFALTAYLSAGLTVVAVMRNREEQALRIRAEEQLRTLVESSPAGIATLDGGGVVLAANNALNEVFGLPPDDGIKGKNIDRYLPVLADALRVNTGDTPFRTSAQSQGRRENGEPFLADVWFSTYPTPQGQRLAAIVIDSSEEMREREEQNLRHLSISSRILAGAMLHEIRNLCSAISAVYADLSNRPAAENREQLEGLRHLVEGLARISSLDLRTREAAGLESVALKEVLNDLRIVVEPAWSDLGATIRWTMPPEIPRVYADRHGLLQVFLNLVQNSRWAVQDAPVQELTIKVATLPEKVQVHFEDTGCGVADPQRLFQPFQSAAQSSGLGLYISRSLLRNYGGDLRFEPRSRGACFLVELPRVAVKGNGHG